VTDARKPGGETLRETSRSGGLRPESLAASSAAANTDRELWRKGGGDGDGMSYYEPSIHVTQDERIGINVGGYVFELLVEEWHQLAAERFTRPDPSGIRSPRRKRA